MFAVFIVLAVREGEYGSSKNIFGNVLSGGKGGLWGGRPKIYLQQNTAA